MGVGSTAIAAKKIGRKCFGIEVNQDFCNVANSRIKENNTMLGDSRKTKNYKIDNVDFIVTSPPYWDMLKKKRGNSDSQHNQREEKKLKLLKLFWGNLIFFQLNFKFFNFFLYLFNLFINHS